LLALLFAGALAGLVALLYAAAHWALLKTPPTPQTVEYDLLLDVGLGVLALVSGGTIYKVLALAAGGGAAVAESMGGKLISPATRDPAEKQLLNITGEMALAAGCPAPQVYVLPDGNINAFAAGTKIGNAVIGVTRGAMNAFSRDEMQGVIAHEFSHIMNGDMRLNLRLIGIIHGIMLLSYLGYFILRGSFYASFSSSRYASFSSSRNGAAAALPLLGIGLIAAGSVGAFFGGLIRAAVSRQREFLADAAAVQYTRNPQGIGGALQKIGQKYGLLRNPKAAECAHMFFAPGVALSFSNMFASHPPIDIRIKRVLPEWDGALKERKPDAQFAQAAQLSPSAAGAYAGFAAMSSALNPLPQDEIAQNQSAQGAPPDLFAAIFGESEAAADIESRAGTFADFAAAGKILQNMPPPLAAALEDSYAARALVYAFLLDEKNAGCRRAQCEHLAAFADQGVHELTLAIAPEITRLPRAARLLLLMQALPALRALSPAQYAVFAHNLSVLIAADEKIDLFEWSAETAVLHYLEEHFGEAAAQKLPAGKDAAEYALSVLAQAGHRAGAAAAFAAAAGEANLQYQNTPFAPRPLSLAMRRLGKMSPAQKRGFLKLAANIAAHNGVINLDEGVLLRAFAALLDCPLPPVFGGQASEK
ncbi:MAG: M48 family metallopeptidase, partial [Gammaproteobacteria bacterium]